MTDAALRAGPATAEPCPLDTDLLRGADQISQFMFGEPSTAQWLLICRCAAITVQTEMLDQRIVTGEPVDPSHYTSLTGTLTRTLKTLGLERRAKDITPGATLDAHAAAVHAADPFNS